MKFSDVRIFFFSNFKKKFGLKNINLLFVIKKKFLKKKKFFLNEKIGCGNFFSYIYTERRKNKN
jgi:hypothetical protein